jgi:glycerol kinase
MDKAILGIDIGTTRVKAMIIAENGNVLSFAARQVQLTHPKQGLAEQSPEILWSACMDSIKESLKKAHLKPQNISAIGVTSQRASLVLWDRKTTQPISSIVSWQDGRGVERAAQLQAEGFNISYIHPAAKLEAVIKGLNMDPTGLSNVYWGNVDSFIVAKLTGGAAHITDASQAFALGYYDPQTNSWNQRLIDYQQLDAQIFPSIVDSSGELAMTSQKVFGAEVPIAAMIGDQQSAAFAQSCRTNGQCKVTYGTAAIVDMYTTAIPQLSGAGSYPIILWRLNGQTHYGSEGMMITGGKTFEALRNLIPDLDKIMPLVSDLEDSHGVCMLPAFQGLGTPYYQADQRAMITGIGPYTKPVHLVRAAMEGVAFRVREIIEQIQKDTNLPCSSPVRVDGNATRNNELMQIQADVLGIPIERRTPVEATVFGAVLLAGIQTGVWKDDETLLSLRPIDRGFEPTWNQEKRDAKFQEWETALYLQPVTH